MRLSIINMVTVSAFILISANSVSAASADAACGRDCEIKCEEQVGGEAQDASKAGNPMSKAEITKALMGCTKSCIKGKKCNPTPALTKCLGECGGNCVRQVMPEAAQHKLSAKVTKELIGKCSQRCAQNCQ